VRKNVRGFIINKFRGDPAILESGLTELEERTGIPVLGVLPHFKLRIPSEDSVSIGDKSSDCSGVHDVDIAVIRLPRISNFTDFEPLERIAKVRYVDLDDGLGNPDAIIIPGTKNTTSDLHDLMESGMADKIRSFHGKIPILGICGGYQMLGQSILDSGIEGGEAATFDGLGLLDIETVFDAYEKRTVQVTKTIKKCGPIFDNIAGEDVKGYEIHMGMSSSKKPVFGDDGCADESGLVIGTYLHGLFENQNVRHALVRYLAEKKGLEFEDEDVPEQDPYDELADVIRERLDMPRIYEMLGLDPEGL
jgi:adenosylcobyric acid synthase